MEANSSGAVINSSNSNKAIITGGDSTDGRPQIIKPQAVNCPRCNSSHTKFCYYNNYSLTQPRYFCKTCRRYWTEGGSLRNVPVGGGSRKNKRSSTSSSSSLLSKINKLSSGSTTSYNSHENPTCNKMMFQECQDLNLAYPQVPPILPEFVGFPRTSTPTNICTSSAYDLLQHDHTSSDMFKSGSINGGMIRSGGFSSFISMFNPSAFFSDSTNTTATPLVYSSSSSSTVPTSGHLLPNHFQELVSKPMFTSGLDFSHGRLFGSRDDDNDLQRANHDDDDDDQQHHNDQEKINNVRGNNNNSHEKLFFPIIDQDLKRQQHQPAAVVPNNASSSTPPEELLMHQQKNIMVTAHESNGSYWNIVNGYQG